MLSISANGKELRLASLKGGECYFRCKQIDYSESDGEYIAVFDVQLTDEELEILDDELPPRSRDDHHGHDSWGGGGAGAGSSGILSR